MTDKQQPIFILRNQIMTSFRPTYHVDLGIGFDIYSEKVPYSGQSLKENRIIVDLSISHLKSENMIKGLKEAYINGKKIRIEVYLDE